MAKEVADKLEVMAFWTSLIRDEKTALVQRIKASELLARTYGMFKRYEDEPIPPEEIAAERAIQKRYDEMSIEELAKLAYK